MKCFPAFNYYIRNEIKKMSETEAKTFLELAWSMSEAELSGSAARLNGIPLEGNPFPEVGRPPFGVGTTKLDACRSAWESSWHAQDEQLKYQKLVEDAKNKKTE